jgi:hypothetical protein
MTKPGARRSPVTRRIPFSDADVHRTRAVARRSVFRRVVGLGDSRHAPRLVPPDTDRYHPPATGLEIAALAPAGVVFEPWKDSPRHIRQAAAAVRDFLQRTPPAR